MEKKILLLKNNYVFNYIIYYYNPIFGALIV